MTILKWGVGIAFAWLIILLLGIGYDWPVLILVSAIVGLIIGIGLIWIGLIVAVCIKA